MRWTDRYTGTVLDWVYPPRCLLCGAAAGPRWGLCPGCRLALPHNDRPCVRCGVPLGRSGLCGACQSEPPAFCATHAPFRYQAPLVHLIKGLKYSGRLMLARSLGELLAHHIPPRNAAQRLIPVPLHSKRLRQRGFNQALEIARHVSLTLDIPLDYHCVIRTRATSPQATLPHSMRRRNVRGAFRLRRKPPWERVAIIDDVMTTGYTANELARLFRQGGVQHVEVWVLARA